MLKTKLKVTVVIFAVLTLVLIATYIINFSSSKISNDPAHWGQFGDYFGMIISLIGSLAVFVLSYLVYMGQVDRDKWEKQFLELDKTPI